jgi:ribokinase
MARPRVLVVGSANVDFTIAAARLPGPGETVTDGTLLINHGGKGANQAVAAHRLGAEVRFIGCLGDDEAGRAIQAALAREGIGVAGVVLTGEAATGTALIVVDGEGRNQIAVAPGANRHLAVSQIDGRREDFAWAQVVLTQLEIPPATVSRVLEEGRRQGAVTILNPAPIPERPLDAWRLVDHLTPNAGEAERLTGIVVRDHDGGARAGAALRARGVGSVIVTLGAAGAVVCAANERFGVAAWSVSAIDTTAAGDAFNGALAVALAEGRDLAAAARFASATAALACTRRGAQPSLPLRHEVERLLETRA